MPMSHRLECIVDGCDGVIEGESEDEIMTKVEGHVAEKHPDLELDDETVGAVKDAIETV